MSILIYGNGWLGRYMAATYGNSILSKTDIGDYKQVRKDVVGTEAKLIINAAGKTGHPNIDWCEDNKEATSYSNVVGPLVLARVCKEEGARLVHLSSGCIWDMRNNVHEDQVPEPVSFYGETKAACDKLLMQFDPQPLIIRLRMPFDGTRHPKNLITKITKYQKITGLPNSMTYVPDLMSAVAALAEGGHTGIYNVVNPGPCSHWETLELYKRHVDPNFTYDRITKDQLHSFVNARRTDCTLSSYKLEGVGIVLPPAIQRLEEAMIDYGKEENADEDNSTREQ